MPGIITMNTCIHPALKVHTPELRGHSTDRQTGRCWSCVWCGNSIGAPTRDGSYAPSEERRALQCSGRFLGIPSRDPSVPKSNRLHVDIFPFSFIKLGYILCIPLKWSVISCSLELQPVHLYLIAGSPRSLERWAFCTGRVAIHFEGAAWKVGNPALTFHYNNQPGHLLTISLGYCSSFSFYMLVALSGNFWQGVPSILWRAVISWPVFVTGSSNINQFFDGHNSHLTGWIFNAHLQSKLQHVFKEWSPFAIHHKFLY